MVAFTLAQTPVALAAGRMAVPAPRPARQQRSVVRHGIPNPFEAGEVAAADLATSKMLSFGLMTEFSVCSVLDQRILTLVWVAADQ